jgi:hypothetical protein
MHLHEVTLDEAQLISETSLCSISGGPLNLVVIVVEANNVDASKSGYLTGWSTDATADIKNLLAFTEFHAVGKVVLMAGDGLVKRLTGGETAEVER